MRRRNECEVCGLAACDLPDEVDPEEFFEIDNGVEHCITCFVSEPHRCAVCNTLVNGLIGAWQLALKDDTLVFFCNKGHADEWKETHADQVVSG